MKNMNFRYAIAVMALIALLVAVAPVRNVQAAPSLNPDVSGFCSDNDDFGLSHGQCTSIAETNINALAGRGNTDNVTICKALENVFGPFPLGQCVSRLAGF